MNKGEHMYNDFIAFKNIATIVTLLLSTTLYTPYALSASDNALEAQALVLSEGELAQALAPIALYPDTLLTHILIASTYPIDVIEAERWLSHNVALTPLQLARKAEKKNWDASIKILIAFPQVMAKLSENLSWMQNIGDAFLQNEARVLTTIQTLRSQAEQAGSLASMSNVEVIKEQKIIIIEPVKSEVIYVPYYDTRVVYGHWNWSHYPPIYWHAPHHYASRHGSFYWGFGIAISSRFYFSTFHWNKRYIIVNNSTYSNRHSYPHNYQHRKKRVKSYYAKRWNHKPQHRRGVAYSNSRLHKKYYKSRSNVQNTNSYNKGVRRNHTSKGNTYRNKLSRNQHVVKSTKPRKVVVQKYKVKSEVSQRKSYTKSPKVKHQSARQSRHNSGNQTVKVNRHNKNRER